MHIQLFGKTHVLSDSNNIRISLKKSQELLMLLCLRGAQTREQLIDAMWEGQLTPKITDHFKVVVRKLRADLTHELQLPFDPVVLQNGTYGLNPLLTLTCDALISMTSPKPLKSSFQVTREACWKVGIKAGSGPFA